ncbi:ribonuclease H2 subunit B isoform X2 [Capsicum annuum]|uniref:ribonuclease H2 subunit B isoform X2 n=1 Tax=Capsicum annuum TaxID=4072 RepID=UPI001FB1483E|nr:ribonuclease H2 subunit B isoform X2 [Capsicum annuum]
MIPYSNSLFMDHPTTTTLYFTLAPNRRPIWAPIPNFCKIYPFLSHPLSTFPPRSFSCVRKSSMSWWEGLNEARVLIAPEPSKDGNKVEQLLSLRHPKSGNATCYLCVDGSLQELHWFKQSYGSWFLGDYVCEDGRLYTATPVDPVFVLLPIFEEARMKKNDDPGKFRQVDEIIYVVGYPGYQHLSSVAENCMQVVCDVKAVGMTKFFRLNDEKVLKWLCLKSVEQKQPLYLMKVGVTSTYILPSPDRTCGITLGLLLLICYWRLSVHLVIQLKKTLLTLDKNYAARDKKEILADAVSIIGEYLKEEPWLKLICSKLSIDLQDDTKASNSEINSSPMENGFESYHEQGKSEGQEKTTRNKRQTKKIKLETNSLNIKDMFSRATRRGK